MPGLSSRQRRKAAQDDEPTRFAINGDEGAEVPEPEQTDLFTRQRKNKGRDRSRSVLSNLGRDSEKAEDILRAMDGVLLQEFLAACLERRLALMLFRSKNDEALVIVLYEGDEKQYLVLHSEAEANQEAERYATALQQ